MSRPSHFSGAYTLVSNNTYTVNGTTYMVDVEEIGGAPMAAAPVAPVAPAPVAAAPAAPAAPAPAPAAAPAPAPAPAPAAAPAGAEAIKAPMPGNILDVKVANGAAVKKGDILVILEAMKMENEILAPRDGVVVGVSVTKGSTVNSGDLLVSLQ